MYARIDITTIYKTRKMRYQSIWITDLEIGITTNTMTLNLAAKTYGDPSWSSIQSKVDKAQKTKGLLNVFGVYDHTNNQKFTPSYKRKTSKHFLDVIKRVDQKYSNNIRQIFLILDNASIHKSKIVKETLVR
jgi:hypothetical protein